VGDLNNGTPKLSIYRNEKTPDLLPRNVETIRTAWLIRRLPPAFSVLYALVS